MAYMFVLNTSAPGTVGVPKIIHASLHLWALITIQHCAGIHRDYIYECLLLATLGPDTCTHNQYYSSIIYYTDLAHMPGNTDWF